MSKKYPRTSHLSFSPNSRDPDHRLDDKELTSLIGQPVVISEKLDGGSCCLTRTDVYARTHAVPATHPQFNWVKAKHAAIKHLIDVGISVFGENLYAVHSIRYDSGLPSYFMVFAARNDITMHWMPWDDVVKLSHGLGFMHVPVLYKGTFESVSTLRETITRLGSEHSLFGNEREGVVVRRVAGFDDDEFRTSVVKWVRKNHIQTDEHWTSKPLEKQPFLKE